MLRIVKEPAQDVPVVDEFDLCVIGGSCTGVFAAVTAARMGLKVALIEMQGYFGGVSTARLVNVWHSVWDEPGDKQIIGGLSVEFLERLRKRNALIDLGGGRPAWQFCFNPAEMILELDEVIREHAQIRPFLHARFVRPILAEAGVIDAVIIEDKSGRRAIRARQFIDASGDSDLVKRAGGRVEKEDCLQPPTTPFVVSGLAAIREANPDFVLKDDVFDPKYPEALPPGFLWESTVPGCPDLAAVFGTRVHNVDCGDADQLTFAEMEGRRQVRSMMDLIRNHFKEGHKIGLAALPAHIGVRETTRAVCEYRLTEEDVLYGRRFPDAIANGSYRVDIHSSDGAGITLRYLHGLQQVISPGKAVENSRWREEIPENPTFYQIPYRSLVPVNFANLWVAGRIIGTDKGAFGAIRVVINCAQTGEAAGMAAALANRHAVTADAVDPAEIRSQLVSQNHSIML